MIDNVTHHLVPRAAGMVCKYCGAKNADTQQPCEARMDKEGVPLAERAAGWRNDASNSWWGKR